MGCIAPHFLHGLYYVPCTRLQVCVRQDKDQKPRWLTGPFSWEAGEESPSRASSPSTFHTNVQPTPWSPCFSLSAASAAMPPARCSARWSGLAPLASALEDEGKAPWEACSALWLLLQLPNSAVVVWKQPQTIHKRKAGCSIKVLLTKTAEVGPSPRVMLPASGVDVVSFLCNKCPLPPTVGQPEG